MNVPLFEKCIRYITTHYKVALIEDLVQSKELLHTKNKYATIMFDDGYKDNIEYAAPILEKYNCKASFYIATECIEKNIPTWTHILEHTFQYTNITEIEMMFSFLPEEFKVEKLLTKQDRITYLSRLKPYLKTISHEERDLVLDRVIKTYTDTPLPKLMMSWDDLKALKNAGHYIGSHSVTHSMLGTMSNKLEVLHELLTSAKLIQEKLGHFPTTIAYPLGSYNDTTKQIAQKVGYTIGLATKQDIYNPEKEDFFEISRIELYNEPWWKARLRISNTLENIKRWIHYKQ
jgi:peptidoglycan/xylan/chitin deacetylase (PgdA/CDA1 family)